MIGLASIPVDGNSSLGHDEIDHTPTQSSWLVKLWHTGSIALLPVWDSLVRA